MANDIIICEPQCYGFEHANFNASLIMATHYAYPDKKIVFIAEKAHLDKVKTIIETHSNIFDKIYFKIHSLPKRNLSNWKRLPFEFIWCIKLLLAYKKNCDYIILSSITNTGLIALKLCVYIIDRTTHILIIPHSILGMLVKKDKLYNNFISIYKAIKILDMLKIRYIALGKSIYVNLISFDPSFKHKFCILDHPYVWHQYEYRLPKSDKLTFAFLGASGKGLSTFYLIASAVKSYFPHVDFQHIGFVQSDAEITKYSDVLSQLSIEPLSDFDYHERLNGVDYVVWTGQPDYYDYRASATFLDSISHIKPGIYLRNDYMKSYFDELGEFGYLCENDDEIAQTIRNIITEFPVIDYQKQCNTIISARKLFEPKTVSQSLKKILMPND